MKTDKYGEIINHNDTFQEIARALNFKGSCLIGWTDEHMTHFDILFTYKQGGIPTFGGQIQGGIGGSDLFVSIMRIGAFAFEINNRDTAWGYYNEKLSREINFGEVTGQKIADLINGVKKYI